MQRLHMGHRRLSTVHTSLVTSNTRCIDALLSDGGACAAGMLLATCTARVAPQISLSRPQTRAPSGTMRCQIAQNSLSTLNRRTLKALGCMARQRYAERAACMAWRMGSVVGFGGWGRSFPPSPLGAAKGAPPILEHDWLCRNDRSRLGPPAGRMHCRRPRTVPVHEKCTCGFFLGGRGKGGGACQVTNAT